MLLCLFPGVLWLWHFLYIVSVNVQCQAFMCFCCVAGINDGCGWPIRRRWLLPGTLSHLWFAGVRECPPWCSIVGATVTVHQVFCILHYSSNVVASETYLTTIWRQSGIRPWGTEVTPLFHQHAASRTKIIRQTPVWSS